MVHAQFSKQRCEAAGETLQSMHEKLALEVTEADMRLHNELGSHYEKIIQQANNPVRLVDGEHADDAHGPSTYLHLCHSAPPERDSQAWDAAKAQLVQWYVERLRAVRDAQGHTPHWYYCGMTWLMSQRHGGYRGHKTGANTMTRVSTLVGDFAHDWVDLHEAAAIAAGPQAMGPRHDEYGNKVFLGGEGKSEDRKPRYHIYVLQALQVFA